MSDYDKQDVPTAAIVSFVGDETYELEAYGSENTDLKYGDNVEQGDELVRRSDHEENVEQARKSVRREILDKIEKIFEKYENGETPFDSYERAALRPFVKDLEEEVRSL